MISSRVYQITTETASGATCETAVPAFLPGIRLAARGRKATSINVPPVGDADDQYHEYIIAHFVKHAVIADPEPTQTPQIALQHTAEERILRQTVDCRDNSRSIRLDDSLQFLGCTALNPYREAHA